MDNRRDQSEQTAPADQVNVDSATWQRDHAEVLRKKDEARQVRLAQYLARLRGSSNSRSDAPKK